MERRYLKTALRASGKQNKLIGYVAKFNVLSEDLGGFREKIALRAFDESIKSDDIRALLNHNSDFVLGRTTSGTLRLTTDSVGLKAEISLPATQVGRDTWESVNRGDITGMSFGFSTEKDSWDSRDKDNVVRTLEIVSLFDISPVTYPAYPQSEIEARGKTKNQRSKINMKLPDILDEKGRLVKEMRVINDKYGQGESFRSEDEQEYQRMEVRLNELNQMIRKERLEHESVTRESGAIMGPIGASGPLHDEGSKAIRTAAPGELRGFFEPKRDGSARITLDALNLKENGQELQDVRDYLKKGALGIREDQRQRFERRALQSDLDTAGGYMTGEQLASKVIMSLEDMVFLRKWGTVIVAENADSLGAPALDNDPDDPIWTAEIRTGDEDSTMSFEKRALTPHPLAKRIKASKTLIRKANCCEDIIRARLAYKFSTTEENAFLVGTGANEPLGLLVASDAGITTGRDTTTTATGSIKGDDLIECFYALKAQYRKNARWIFGRDAIRIIRKLKTGDGEYLWRPGLTVAQEDLILSKPYVESEYFPSFASTNYAGIVGDFSFFWVVDALTMTVQVLIELYAETNQNGYIGRKETDGMPVLEEAFQRLKLL